MNIPTLNLGPVELNVRDIELEKNFYHEALGLTVLKSEKNRVVLGNQDQALLILHATESPAQKNTKEAGLYHFALLFTSQSDLAKTIARVFKTHREFFTGSADHLVSEAFYLNDPEGNGIELYYDRDRSLWQWEGTQIKMASMYIDPFEYVKQYATDSSNDRDFSMGHIHLKVGDIKKAHDFYVGILGFTVTAQMHGALFISVDGYHHHLGLNTWESFGAGPRKELLGLKTFHLLFQKRADFDALKERLVANKIKFEETDNSLTFLDPWNNEIKTGIL